MFTIDQINEAYSVVKTGADFPKLVKALKNLGVTKVITWVHDGHSQYFDAQNNDVSSVTSCGLYPNIVIADAVDATNFTTKLKAHQRGETDFFTFCKDAAEHGVAYWEILTDAYTCTYKDARNQMVLTETIPQV